MHVYVYVGTCVYARVYMCACVYLCFSGLVCACVRLSFSPRALSFLLSLALYVSLFVV